MKINRPLQLSSKSIFLALLSIIIVAGLLFFHIQKPSFAASNCPQGATLNFVAHEDDDLLFLSPDLLHDVQSGVCVRTVFVTAGDAGGGTNQMAIREAGSKAAYAQMAGVANSWTQADAGISGHPIPVFTLNGNTKISLLFIRLPDGAPDGSGFNEDNDESLQKLWQGNISTIHVIDGSSSYAKQDLINTFLNLMTDFSPNTIRTQDFAGTYGDGDHSDHHSVAYFVLTAHQQYAPSHMLIGYQDYPISSRPANVSGADLTAKENAFFTYAQYDTGVCGSMPACSGTGYDSWLERQYIVSLIAPTNIASLASATASSENTSTSQTADKAIDGMIDGYPGDYTKEWATVGGGAGSWLKLTWSTSHTINKVVLYDRPNLDDQITSGTLTFSDGTVIPFGALNNDGTATTVTFPSVTTTSILLTVTGISSNTYNVGLSEIQVYEGAATTPTPTSIATPTPTSVPTATPTPTPTPTPTSGNIAPLGNGYRWGHNTSATSNSNRVAETGINDGNLTADIALNGGTDESSNAWEAAGVIWSSTQSVIKRVEFINGSWTSSWDGVFTKNFKLQFSTDGTTWTNASGWTLSPAYDYDSSLASGKQYVFSGTMNNVKGVRVIGQVHTGGAASWYDQVREVQIYSQ